MARTRSLLILALALFAIQAASAFPSRFVSRPGQCGKQPTRGFGPHLAPKNDSTIKWVIRPASGGAAIKAPGPLRAGTRYIVTASWTPQHHSLLTASQGSWATIPAGTPSNCKLSAPSLTAAKTYSNTIILATTAKGNVTFAVTHSAPGENYLQSRITYRIQPRTGKML